MGTNLLLGQATTPDTMLLREMDDEFVKQIKSSYNGSLGVFTSTIFPVPVIGKIDQEHPEKSKQLTNLNHLDGIILSVGTHSLPLEGGTGMSRGHYPPFFFRPLGTP